jgi:ubiquinone/menaquinone biosynthesis C-methylase UbiE
MGVFDAYFKEYDAWYDTHPYAYASELETLKRVIPDKGMGLEIGVGTGRFASALGIAVGVDPSQQMVDTAARRGVTVCRGCGEQLPFLDHSFDYAAIIIALCFVRDPARVLQEARRVLKRNGTLIIGIIDKDSFLGRHYHTKKSVFYRQAHFFSVPELTDMLRAAGYHLFSYFQTIFTVLDEMRSAQKPRRGFGDGGFVVISAHG